MDDSPVPLLQTSLHLTQRFMILFAEQKINTISGYVNINTVNEFQWDEYERGSSTF